MAMNMSILLQQSVMQLLMERKSICPLKRIFFDKKMGNDAFKYAEQHNVLMVHCAGIIVLMLMKTHYPNGIL
jgi:hypothetical protein